MFPHGKVGREKVNIALRTDMWTHTHHSGMSPHISTQVANLFNESLATSTLPTEFKSGTISPIVKPGKRDNSTPNSYRGISLTCVLSKVLEKIAHQPLESYFKKQGAYHEDQYGFRKGRSCGDLLLGTTDDWMIEEDRKLSTAIVFIDLSKAFDNVQHDKLLLNCRNLQWVARY